MTSLELRNLGLGPSVNVALLGAHRIDAGGWIIGADSNLDRELHQAAQGHQPIASRERLFIAKDFR